MDRISFLKKTLEFLSIKAVDWEQADDEQKVIRENMTPESLKRAFDLSIRDKGVSEDELLDSLEKVIELSVNTGSKMFMNQMYGNVNVAAVAGDWVSTLLNTSMYTYEVAPLLTLMEMECVRELSSLVWEDGGDGVLTPGGSISNMEAIVFARNNKYPESSAKGIPDGQRPAIFISEQAHYSFKKGAIFLGFGHEAVIQVKSDDEGKIIPEELESEIESAIEQGMHPMMVVGVAGTTIAGFFDDLPVVASIADKYNMWFHVDAVYGGSLLFSKERRKMLKGIDLADSVSWNLHKISGIPLVCSVVLTKEKGVLNETFSVDADYLFHEQDADIDMGQKSIQCGRRVDALKLWAALKKDGLEGFGERVDKLMNGARTLADLVEQEENLELYNYPESPIVLFRYKGDVPEEVTDELNQHVRDEIFNEGRILFNYTNIADKTWIRCVISNPEFESEDAKRIISTFIESAEIVKQEEFYQYESS